MPLDRHGRKGVLEVGVELTRSRFFDPATLRSRDCKHRVRTAPACLPRGGRQESRSAGEVSVSRSKSAASGLLTPAGGRAPEVRAPEVRAAEVRAGEARAVPSEPSRPSSRTAASSRPRSNGGLPRPPNSPHTPGTWSSRQPISAATRLRNRRSRRHRLARQAAEQNLVRAGAPGLNRSPQPSHTRPAASLASSDTQPGQGSKLPKTEDQKQVLTPHPVRGGASPHRTDRARHRRRTEARKRLTPYPCNRCTAVAV